MCKTLIEITNNNFSAIKYKYYAVSSATIHSVANVRRYVTKLQGVRGILSAPPPRAYYLCVRSTVVPVASKTHGSPATGVTGRGKPSDSVVLARTARVRRMGAISLRRALNRDAAVKLKSVPRLQRRSDCKIVSRRHRPGTLCPPVSRI